MQFSKALFSKIVYMFILYNNQIINSEFCSHSKLEIMHSHCHIKTMHCMMKTIQQNESNTLENKNTAMQNEDITLKYKVNQATLLPLPLKIKITATEYQEGKK